MHKVTMSRQELTEKEEILFRKFNRRERREIMRENGMFKKGNDWLDRKIKKGGR